MTNMWNTAETLTVVRLRVDKTKKLAKIWDLEFFKEKLQWLVSQVVKRGLPM